MKNGKKRKMEKNDEKIKKMKKFGFRRKILDDFQGLPFLLYLFFVKFFDDFHDFVSECVSFQRKINNPFCGVSVFQRKIDNFHWT